MILNRNDEGVYNLLITKYLMSEEDQFMKYFRISSNLFYKILHRISDQISTAPTFRVPKPISAEQKLCVMWDSSITYKSYFRFLATGESQASLSFSFRISRTKISQIIKEVFGVIKTELFFELTPPTNDLFEMNGIEFGRKWNFLNVMGCLDGKHVRIRCPGKRDQFTIITKIFSQLFCLLSLAQNTNLLLLI